MGSRNSLPSFGADSKYTTISGFSGGTGFANNLHVAHSETIKGVGLINGSPYAIGTYKDIAGIFDYDMVSSEIALESITLADRYEKEGKIDDLSNLKMAPVVIFSSGMDPVMIKPMQDAQEMFYENYGANVEFQYYPTFQHTWPLDVPIDVKPFGECSVFPPSRTQNCGVDTSGIILNTLLKGVPGSNIKELSPKTFNWQNKGIIKAFDQKEFIDKEVFQYSGLDN